jgi:hypothetical protein
MKIKFRDVRLSKSNKEKLELVNSIIEEYQEQGYVLTLRQLYYQLVSRDVIPNKQAEYSKLSTLLKEGRMAGLVDWDAIEDRLRKPYTPASFESPKDIIKAAMQQFCLDRQDGQDNYLECWVEKDALSGVLKRVTSKYHVPILVNRGYSSVSSMYDSFVRFEMALRARQKVKIIYLGDFDPSGIDMIRDIETRISEFLLGYESQRYFPKFFHEAYPTKDEQWKYLEEFNQDFTEEKDKFKLGEVIEMYEEGRRVEWVKENFEVIPIALNKHQVEQYDLPPNPAKTTDPRSKEFIATHGNESWEVDALNPSILNNLLENSIKSFIDLDLYNDILVREEEDKLKLKEVLESM